MQSARRVQLTKAVSGFQPPEFALGQWCARDDLSGTGFLSDGPSAEDFVQLESDFKYLYDNTLSSLTAILNHTYGIRRSERYWALVLHPMLTGYIKHFTVKWRVVERALRESSFQWHVDVLFPDIRSVPATYPILRRAHVHDDLFNLEIFSLVCRALDIRVERRPRTTWGSEEQLGRLSRVANSRVLLSESYRAFLSYYSRKVVAARRGTGVVGGYGGGVLLYNGLDPAFVRALASKAERDFKPLSAVASLFSWPRLTPSRDLRTRADWSHPVPVVDALLKGLQYHLPVQELEPFRHLRRAVQRQLDKEGTPEAILFCLLVNQGYRVFAAEAMHRGSRLVAVQHGGAYGETTHQIPDHVERRFADVFVTMGWQRDPVKDVPAGGFRLNKLKPSDEAPNGEILFLCQTQQEYPHSRMWAPRNRQQQHAAFLQHLQPEVRRSIKARLKLNRKANVKLQRGWLDPFPEVQLCDWRVPVHQQMRASSLIIVGYIFSTALLEALTLDKPVIVLDSQFRDMFTDEARPYYQRLIEADVVFDDPVKAAATVAAAFGDPREWWHEDRRRSAIAAFRDRFARKADVDRWAEVMNRLREPELVAAT